MATVQMATRGNQRINYHNTLFVATKNAKGVQDDKALRRVRQN